VSLGNIWNMEAERCKVDY